MWLVWSLTGMLGFCFDLSVFDNAPGESRRKPKRRSWHGSHGAILLAIS